MQDRVSLDLMGIHNNPSQKVLTPPNNFLSAPEVWNSTGLVSTIQGCDLNGNQFLKGDAKQNTLLACIDLAFNEHRPLALTPDDFFFPLAQSAALHIDKLLREKKTVLGLTPQTQKVKLIVRRDDFSLERSDNPWDQIFEDFGNQIEGYIGSDNYHLLRGDFSTSGAFQNAAYDVNLMDACKSYYDYHNMFGCGIPQINLIGSSQDWKNLKTKSLAICDLVPVPGWKEALDDILTKIIHSYDNPNDQESCKFWCNMYRKGHHSGGNHIDGWINLFFPWIRCREELELSKDVGNMNGKGMLGGRNVNSYQSSVASAPVSCNDRGRQVELRYFAGQVGIQWNPDHHEVSPGWGWCVSILQ
eukprot:TRINITY_DN703_c0_g1_i3.p1 TRINITY_DN703_c0_g1~~TRINITY_DN703_c0_g1_i3.p1  ORF type:complete len:358 (-),score=100.17 TRINITY_DN703_c0_g1_i3:48-1121(-)